jgi:hypothetical protein
MLQTGGSMHSTVPSMCAGGEELQSRHKKQRGLLVTQCKPWSNLALIDMCWKENITAMVLAVGTAGTAGWSVGNRAKHRIHGVPGP